VTEQRELKAWQLKTAVNLLPEEASVFVRFEGSSAMSIEKVTLIRDEKDREVLELVLPTQPTDSAVDSDLTRLCENMVTGKSTIFQVRFGMDVLEKCNAHTGGERLKVLSHYFGEAQRQVDEIISFGQEAGEVAAEEDDS
jgi:hypothetical protein